MNIVDSSGWLEFFTDGKNADKYGKFLEEPKKLIIPSIVLYEVYKKIKLSVSEEKALAAAGFMGEGQVIALTDDLAFYAADVSIEHKLPMADAIIYATALTHKAKVITSDKHFKHLENVVYIE